MSDGRKDDAGKRRYDLLPVLAEGAIVDVLTYGAAKYGEENWRHVEYSERRYYAAARRHLAAWLSGEGTDAESGLPHLAHAATCLIFLLEKQVESGDVGGK
jgi:hypothetical protein